MIPPAKRLPGTLDKTRSLDAWITVNTDGTITVRTGKVEIGQGIKTAVAMVAAEELDVALSRIRVHTADTGVTPDERTTSGSQSMQHSAAAIRQAAAECRHDLLALAARTLGVPSDDLAVEDGTVRSRRTNRQTDYWTLMGGRTFGREATGEVAPKLADTHRIVGRPATRLDIPAKVFGEATFIHDLELPNMVHGRVIRPSGQPARLKHVDLGRASALPGVIQVIRDSNFLAVIAEREIDAIQARRALIETAQWDSGAVNPPEDGLYEWLLGQPTVDRGVVAGAQIDEAPEETPPPAGAAATVESYYAKPYLLHAALGPSCAIAEFKDGALTVWTHSQGVYPLRGSIASVLGMDPDLIRCIHVEGSGCYGHNGADDVAFDAALLALAVPRRPVRVQWHREDENVWEPFSTPMVVRSRASLGANGKVSDWRFDIWSHNHGQRPKASKSYSNLLAASQIEKAWPRPPQKPGDGKEASEHRNAWPGYDFETPRIAKHFIADPAFRCSSLRGLGAFCNVFAIESMMDELARASGQDAVAFRLGHLRDPRARAVIEDAARRIGWNPKAGGDGRGQGLAYARYKNMAAYCAVAVELTIDRASGVIRLERVAAAADVGEAVSPDGVVNQIEGGIVQATSWTLKERVRFGPAEVTSRDWATYPILTFAEAPPAMETVVLDRPGEPFLGVGEASQGPTPAAIANAVENAIGVRLRELPFTPERVRAMLAQAGRT